MPLSASSQSISHFSKTECLEQISQENLRQKLYNISSSKDIFEDKLFKLCSIFTKCGVDIYGAHVITDKNVKLKIIIDKGDYLSNLMPYIPQKEEKFYYVHLFDEDFCTKLIELRSSTDGFQGELVQLARGNKISGSEVIKFFVAIESCLKIRHMYLLDDSKIKLNVSISKNSKRKRIKIIILRVALPICQKIPQTQYQKELGFYSTQCSNWHGIHDGIAYNQDPIFYKNSITYIRNTKLNELKSLFPGFSELLKRLKQKYLYQNNKFKKNYSKIQIPSPEIVQSNKTSLVIKLYNTSKFKRNTRMNNYTVHDLGHKILQAAKKERILYYKKAIKPQQNQEKNNRAKMDNFQEINIQPKALGHDQNTSSLSVPYDSPLANLAEFCEAFLDPEIARIQHIKSIYLDCLNQIYTTQIFEYKRQNQILSQTNQKNGSFSNSYFTEIKNQTVDQKNNNKHIIKLISIKSPLLKNKNSSKLRTRRKQLSENLTKKRRLKKDSLSVSKLSQKRSNNIKQQCEPCLRSDVTCDGGQPCKRCKRLFFKQKRRPRLISMFCKTQIPARERKNDDKFIVNLSTTNKKCKQNSTLNLTSFSDKMANQYQTINDNSNIPSYLRQQNAKTKSRISKRRVNKIHNNLPSSILSRNNRRRLSQSNKKLTHNQKNITDKKLLIRLMKIIMPSNEYGRNWCRYCGAKIASSYSKSPQGPRKLCVPHYVLAHQHHTLDLSKQPKEPKKPINPSANSEIKYMNTILRKYGVGRGILSNTGKVLLKM